MSRVACISGYAPWAFYGAAEDVNTEIVRECAERRKRGNFLVKNILFSIFTLVLGICVHVSTTTAQDYMQMNLPEGAKIRLGKGTIQVLAYSPDGAQLAVATRIGVWLSDAETGEVLNLIVGHTAAVQCMAFSPDGRTLATGSLDETARLWDVNTAQPIHTLRGHTAGVTSVAFSPDGRTLATGSDGEPTTVRLWDVDTGIHIRTLRGHTGTVNSMVFNPDGRTLATGSLDETVRLWDARTGVPLQTLTRQEVASIAFSPDGRTLVIGSWRGAVDLWLWFANTATHIRTLRGHTNSVGSIAFSPDGHAIATGSLDETVRLWDAGTGVYIRTLTGHTSGVVSVVFNPDGKRIATGSWDGTVRLWGANVGHIRALRGHTGSVNSVVFSSDGMLIATGSSDRTVRLWDAHTGQHIRTLRGHTGAISSVAFSLDGRQFASGSDDGTALLWELMPAVTSNAVVGLSLTPVQSPKIGERLTVLLTITDAENITGYQANISYDAANLRYVSSTNGDYLPGDASFLTPTLKGNTVTITANALSGESTGDGTLATLTFEIVGVQTSALTVANVLLFNGAGFSFRPRLETTQIIAITQPAEDINEDGVIDAEDLALVRANLGETGENAADVDEDGVVTITDLLLVATAIENAAAAPSLWNMALETAFTRAEVVQWLHQARQAHLTGPAFQRGVLMLERLLAFLTPKATALLPNYPNPFNPETWIPYRLAAPGDVKISIYAADGGLIRTLALGHQPVGVYEHRSRAVYWDGRNVQGEPVASGVYFYTLTVGDFTATRKLLIRK